MKDLRNEIREEFEREQIAFPPPRDLRPRLGRAAASQVSARRDAQWLAAVAVVVIAALIVLSLMLARGAAQKPTPAATPSAPSDYGPPPSGVPLIYMNEPKHDGWYVGFDWSGRPRGTVKLPSPPSTGVLMAPDGEAFAYGLYAKGGAWQFLDRLGQPTGSDNVPGAYSTMWADDNRHVCAITIDANTLAYTLWSAMPGESAHGVTEIARDKSVGQTSISLAACSFHNDRAIAVRTTVGWPAELWVLRLSDGKALAHHTYAPGLLTTVVASADAAYVGETSAQATTESLYAARWTQIRTVSDWSVVAKMDPGYVIQAFSSNDSSVLVQSEITVLDQPSIVMILGWQEGDATARWRYAGPEQLVDWTAEPGGGGFALGFLPVGHDAAAGCARGASPCNQLQAITIVQGRGAAVDLPDRYNPTW